ncbi:MAG: class I SAM-dependent methyltransferase [Chitinophagaceae bacterium]|nr:class I SAM-dependent methyltransferase [Chitinophagaceae bacterium]
MIVTDFKKAQGHWLLAKMGKKVLRPGGKELTAKLIDGLQIAGTDDIVEFAPGLGFTASLALGNNPRSYVGVDADNDAIEALQEKIKGDHIRFIQGTAAHTDLPDDGKDKVYGEAMLTMQADHRKAEIIREAHRILKKGGLYAIHELGLTPDSLGEAVKAEIQKKLAQTIQVNARPLTEVEWKILLEKEGFEVMNVFTNSMSLLETKRVIDDEGFWRSLRIAFNILIYPAARKRILAMRSVFRRYSGHMTGIVIIARKI